MGERGSLRLEGGQLSWSPGSFGSRITKDEMDEVIEILTFVRTQMDQDS